MRFTQNSNLKGTFYVNEIVITVPYNTYISPVKYPNRRFFKFLSDTSISVDQVTDICV